MNDKAPPGWKTNPSSFSRRARIASGAAIAAALALTLETESSRTAAMILIASGALSLISGTRRWCTRPWLVLMNGIVAIPLSMSFTVAIVFSFVRNDLVTPFELGFVALTAWIASAVTDECLASLQHLRRQVDHGKSLIRALFGFSSRRRHGQAVSLDEVLTPKVGQGR